MRAMKQVLPSYDSLNCLKFKFTSPDSDVQELCMGADETNTTVMRFSNVINASLPVQSQMSRSYAWEQMKQMLMSCDFQI